MLVPWTACAAACALIPAATAFYPYEPSSAGTKHASRRDDLQKAGTRYASNRALTLPLRRAPLRSRGNQYKILNSADPKQKNSVAVDQDGSDISYMAAVTIGDSKEEYHLLLDSAATNTWVMGQDCTSEACGKHNTFGKGDSSTLKVCRTFATLAFRTYKATSNTLQTSSTPFSITYGTGSVSGTSATDTLHISSLSLPLTFGLATNVSQEFSAYPMDGILGLGKASSASALSAPQLISALADAKLISSKLYGIHLPRAADGAADGELNLGEVNTALFDGDLTWTKTIDNADGFWEIPIADAGAADSTLGLKGKSAILDTGTSYLFMPPSDAASLHALVDGASQDGETFIVPCDTQHDVQIAFGTRTFAVSHKDWIGGTVDGGCRSNIFGRQTFGEGQWLVGDVFLKNVYAVFDFDKARVGFGVKEGVEKEESSSSEVETPMGTPTPTPSASSTSQAGAFLPAKASAEASATTVGEEAGASGASSSAAATGGVAGRGVGKGGFAMWMVGVGVGVVVFG